MGIKKNKAFTLIETMVVIGVVGIVLPALFAIVFSILQQQTKIMRLQTVKKEGDYVLGMIKTGIKNSAVSIHSSVPPTDLNKICLDNQLDTASYFKDRTNGWFRYYIPANSNRIASESASSVSGGNYMTSNKVYVDSFSINCYKPGDYSPAIVEVRYELCYNNGSACNSIRPEENVKITYQTKIKLRVIDF